MQFFACLGQ